MIENSSVSVPVVPTVTPQVVVEQPQQSSFLIILLSVLLFLSVSIAGFFAYQTQKLVKELTLLKSEEKVTAIATTEPTAEPVATNSPVISDGSVTDWKKYSDKTYTFEYPSSWNVVPGTKNYEDAFGGDYVQIVAPSPTVTIEIAPSQFTYGFEGQSVHTTGKTYKINIGGQEYSGTEDIRTESGITKTFVNITVPVLNKEFHILFGTGYPVNEDKLASNEDYLKYRDTIIKIISTLVITN